MYCAILISNRHKTTFAVDQPLVTMFENRQIVLEMIDNISRENSLVISMWRKNCSISFCQCEFLKIKWDFLSHFQTLWMRRIVTCAFKEKYLQYFPPVEVCGVWRFLRPGIHRPHHAEWLARCKHWQRSTHQHEIAHPWNKKQRTEKWKQFDAMTFTTVKKLLLLQRCFD